VRYYTVRPGDTLSSLAKRFYGSADLWPALWWVSKAKIPNPNVLRAGQVIKIDPWHPGYAWLAHAALQAIPAPPPPLRHEAATARQSAGSYRTVSSGGYSGNVSAGSYSGYQACVVERESGGQSQVMNASGHYGLYQFDAGTWASGGGSAADFGHASVAEQNRVFAAVYAARGTQPWSPSDGC